MCRGRSEETGRFANEQFISALSAGGETCAVASEENEGLINIDSEVSKNAKYVVCVDPLDGSSNIDVNVSIGTIFSIYRRTSFGGIVEETDYLQRGTEQVAAGYIIYGSSTMLVYTTGKGSQRLHTGSQYRGILPLAP